MEKNKIIELFHNKEFVEKFKKINTTEGAIELFKNNGVDINDDSIKEICDKYMESNWKFSDEDLSEVVGGIDGKKISQNLGEKIGGFGARIGVVGVKAYDYLKIFAEACKKGYADMYLRLSTKKDDDSENNENNDNNENV